MTAKKRAKEPSIYKHNEHNVPSGYKETHSKTPTASPIHSHLSTLAPDHALFPTAYDPAPAQLQSRSPQPSVRHSAKPTDDEQGTGSDLVYVHVPVNDGVNDDPHCVMVSRPYGVMTL